MEEDLNDPSDELKPNMKENLKDSPEKLKSNMEEDLKNPQEVDSFGAKEPRLGYFPMDAIFSPITKVNYTVEAVEKKGEIIYFEIWTNGSIDPRYAIHQTVKAVIALFLPLQKTFPAPLHINRLKRKKQKISQTLSQIRLFERLNLFLQSDKLLSFNQTKTIQKKQKTEDNTWGWLQKTDFSLIEKRHRSKTLAEVKQLLLKAFPPDAKT